MTTEAVTPAALLSGSRPARRGCCTNRRRDVRHPGAPPVGGGDELVARRIQQQIAHDDIRQRAVVDSAARAAVQRAEGAEICAEVERRRQRARVNGDRVDRYIRQVAGDVRPGAAGVARVKDVARVGAGLKAADDGVRVGGVQQVDGDVTDKPVRQAICCRVGPAAAAVGGHIEVARAGWRGVGRARVDDVAVVRCDADRRYAASPDECRFCDARAAAETRADRATKRPRSSFGRGGPARRTACSGWPGSSRAAR